MQFGKRIGPLARRVAAMQIPVYAGNASFFLLLSLFPHPASIPAAIIAVKVIAITFLFIIFSPIL